MLLCLCGCRRDAPTQQPETAALTPFAVSFTLDTDVPVHAVTFEYCVGREPVGGMTLSQDPSRAAPLRTGESMMLRFEEAMFPDGAALVEQPFGLMVYVDTAEGETRPAEALIEWQATFGGEYVFTLTGNEQQGFAFLPADVGEYTITPRAAWDETIPCVEP